MRNVLRLLHESLCELLEAVMSPETAREKYGLECPLPPDA